MANLSKKYQHGDKVYIVLQDKFYIAKILEPTKMVSKKDIDAYKELIKEFRPLTMGDTAICKWLDDSGLTIEKVKDLLPITQAVEVLYGRK